MIGFSRKGLQAQYQTGFSRLFIPPAFSRWLLNYHKEMKEKAIVGPVHKIPTDLKEAIHSKSTIKAAWKSITPLARNEWICWVTSAKKPETRNKRIKQAQEQLVEGQSRPCCWPGCPHRRPSAKKWFK